MLRSKDILSLSSPPLYYNFLPIDIKKYNKFLLFHGRRRISRSDPNHPADALILIGSFASIDRVAVRKGCFLDRIYHDYAVVQ